MGKNVSKNDTRTADVVLTYLPEKVKNALTEFIERSGKGLSNVSEIRLRIFGVCSVTVCGENVPLNVNLDAVQMKETLRRISGGALFVHKDDLCRGFITLAHGIRVGVIGRAKYEDSRILGVDEISALVFRIPSGECSFAKELYGEWLFHGGGILICSSAGGGKTTAIRSLAGLIGSGEVPRRVVVVDERCEFDTGEYSGAHVDILRGYRRALGVDIAIRTMSAEILIVDEISSEDDATAMLSSLGAGVTVIATAHACSFSDAMKRAYIRRLVDGGLFEWLCVIERHGESYSYKLESINEKYREKLHGMGDI